MRNMRYHARMNTVNRLGFGRIFVFWSPLAMTWFMMALEGPILAAIVARLAEPKVNLAAHGVAFAIAIIIEAPVIMMMYHCSPSTSRQSARARRERTNRAGMTVRTGTIQL